CGATCENNEDCEETVCTSGCVGNDWYEYSDVSNSCNSCGCGQNECGEPTVIPNDKRCVQCTDNSQCANLTKESCSGEAHVIKEGVCVDYKCQLAHPSVIEDCSLKDGIVGCGELQWGCTEEINRIHCTITDITPNDALCLDDSGCNGLETCNPVTYICEQGQAVDCSVFNISRIDSCDNNPDNNPFTIDLRTAFTSQCVDLEQGQFECTTGNEEITHDCSLGCGAECDAQNLCSNKEGNKTFYDDCNEKMLVDYNDNSKLDNTTVTASCSRDCDLDSCGCGDCDLIFEDLIPETKCVLGVCGATCENNEDCEETVCTSGCVGNDWYEYSNVSNSCNSCACEQNQCGAPVITENDPICGECVNGDEESRNCGSSDIGVCEFGNQTRTCEDGEWQQWGECTGEVLPGTETCNNLDDDCDILIDEGFNKGGACSAGIGVCMNNGTLVCSQDGLGTECSAQPLPPQEQTETSCSDHQDNDCDGLIDCQDSDCQEQPGCHIECFDDSWCEPWPLACHGNFCFDSDTIYQNITRGKCEMPGTTLSRCVVEWSVINWQECYPGICQGEWPNAQCVDNFCENDSECGTSLLLNNYCVGNDLYSNYTRHYCDGVCKLDFEQMLNETNSSICFEECSVNEDCPAGSSETFCINQSLINSTRVPYCEANRCGFNEINNTIGSCNNETNNETNPPVNNNPVVNLVSPVNDYVTSSNSIGFEYNVSDDGNISNCNLKINGNITNTVTDVPRNANEMFIKSLAIGTYTWQVSCFDGINYGNSEIRNLRIIEESNNDDNHNSCVSGCGGGSTSLISGVSGCGNGICETGENYNNCQLDCLKSSSSISGLGYQNYSVIELSTVKKKTSSGWWWVWLLILLILLLLLLLLLLLTRKSDN
ncbi:MAG: hypothetical protein NT076_04000, partial [Candidatus Pacearchaeota archaeon]|nr:hypothetical protein [Candidatus Pacearchaeota archaeon]